ESTLFGTEHPAPAEVLIAEWEGAPAGMALYFQSYSTFLAQPGLYLEDLFVLPEFRSQSIGKHLLMELVKIANERVCGRLEWSVLKWNQRAIDFYLKLGAKPQQEWTVFRLGPQDLKRLSSENT
ncbi:MAG: GNAT family N-acetyltransferase, partial [Bdellovibrio sp.]